MRARRGISSIKLLVALPAILVSSWLGIEFGLVLRAIQQAKSAADAAALAAAARLTSDFETYGDAAVLAAAANPGPSGGMAIQVAMDNAGGDLIVGTWDPDARLFTADPNAMDAVEVTVRIGAGAPNASPGYILPNILELVDATFRQSSVATMTPAPASASMLCTEETSPRTVDLSGNVVLDSFGDIEVASSDSNAVRIRGNASMTVATLRVAGGLQGDSGDAVDGFIETDAVILDDPFEAIAQPPLLPVSEGPDLLGPESVSTLEPGRHPEGLLIEQGTVRLLPGLHQFGGSGLRISGSATIELIDATIQLLDTGTLVIDGMGSLNGTPPTGGDWDDVFLIAPKTDSVALTNRGSALVPGVAWCPDAIIRLENDASMVIDGMIMRKLIQRDRTDARLDRVIIAAPIESTARARLRR